MGVTGSPLTNGHTLVGLHAQRQLDLDAVVYIVHGDIRHKPVAAVDGVPPETRHRMAEKALDPYAPALQYSDVSLGSDRLSEWSLQTLRYWNLGRRIKWHFIAGAESSPERAALDRMRFIVGNLIDASREHHLAWQPEHQLAVCFVERGEPARDLVRAVQAEFAPGLADAGLDPMIGWLPELHPAVGRMSASRFRRTFDPRLVSPKVLRIVTQERLYGFPG
jgi:hypothetical protein